MRSKDILLFSSCHSKRSKLMQNDELFVFNKRGFTRRPVLRFPLVLRSLKMARVLWIAPRTPAIDRFDYTRAGLQVLYFH